MSLIASVLFTEKLNRIYDSQILKNYFPHFRLKFNSFTNFQSCYNLIFGCYFYIIIIFEQMKIQDIFKMWFFELYFEEIMKMFEINFIPLTVCTITIAHEIFAMRANTLNLVIYTEDSVLSTNNCLKGMTLFHWTLDWYCNFMSFISISHCYYRDCNAVSDRVTAYHKETRLIVTNW